MITFFMLSYFSIAEYKFLKSHFGTRKDSPIKGIVIMQSVFAFSFLFRASINITIAVDTQAVLQMQCKAVVYNKIGWSMLVFGLQFFGETVPLCILFYICGRNAAPPRRRPSKIASPLLTNQNTFNSSNPHSSSHLPTDGTQETRE